jgi:type III secretory pathway component EscS
MATKDKNIWILLIFILSGIVIGGLLGEIASKVDVLWWLNYGQEFGMSEPFTLDLSIMKISFSLMFKITVASIIGIAISIFVYRKV